MDAQIISVPADELRAVLKHQATQVGSLVAGFAGAVATEGLGKATQRLLRDVLTVVAAYDLANLSAEDGRQLATIFEDSRAAIRDELAGAVGTASIDAGLDAAIELANMIGRPWSDLEAIPDTTLRQRVARVTILANVIENATLAEHLAETRPAAGTPAGVLLN